MKRNIIIILASILALVCLLAFARVTTTDLGLVLPIWTEEDPEYDILVDLIANWNILEDFANDPLEFDTGTRLEDRVDVVLSTWVGDTDITTLGTVTTGVWQATPIVDAYISDTLTVTGYMQDADVNTFAKLQAWVTDKTLVNEEDIFTIDANWVNIANPWADNEVADDLTITAADTTDTTCFVALWETITGAQKVKSDAALTYNAGTGVLTSTGFAGNLLGNVTGALTGNADTVTGFTPASGSLTLSGADALTLTTTASTNVTLPTTGTLLANIVEDTAPELGGDLDCNNLDLVEVKTVEFNGVYAIGNSGATKTVDWENGAYQSITLDEACVISFSNEYVGTLNLEVTYGGSFALTFDGMTLLEEGGVEIVTTDASGVDVLMFKNWGTADTYVMGALLDVKD